MTKIDHDFEQIYLDKEWLGTDTQDIMRHTCKKCKLQFITYTFSVNPAIDYLLMLPCGALNET